MISGNKLNSRTKDHFFYSLSGRLERTLNIETSVDFAIQSSLTDVSAYFEPNHSNLPFDPIHHGFIRRGVKSRFYSSDSLFEGVCTGKITRNAFFDQKVEKSDFLRIVLDDKTIVFVPIDSEGYVDLNQEILEGGKKIYLVSPDGDDIRFYELGLLGDFQSFEEQVYIETSVDDFRKFFSSVELGTCVGMMRVSDLIPHKLSYFTVGDPVGFNGVYLGQVKRRNAHGHASWYAKFWVFEGIFAFVPISEDGFIQVRQDV